ncbi:SLC13 family permease [Bordetella trematum]|uniref:SLC13 family permease n=1 Tax=Bordetella trematum TaxID=123899 RepID=UPI003AF35AA1
MTTEIAVVLGLALVAIVLFATEKLRIDAIALLVLGSLAVLGLVTPEQAVAGFSNPATITVAAMFVLAAGLQNSGALSGIGDLLGRARSPFQFLLVLFLILAAIAPFVNNTAVVAVFIPIVMAATARIGMSPSKALIPLSYVSQMAGVCTLVGTSTNLLVNAIAREHGHPGFTMFEFTSLGLICMGVGCLYLLTVGRWLLPDARGGELVEQYELGKYITELRVMPDSSLIGQSVGDAKLGEEYGVFVLELLRGDAKVWGPREQQIEAGDVLLARGDWTKLDELRKEAGLEVDPQFKLEQRSFEEVEQVLTEVMIAPRSRISGRTLASLGAGWRSQCHGAGHPSPRPGAARQAEGSALAGGRHPAGVDAGGRSCRSARRWQSDRAVRTRGGKGDGLARAVRTGHHGAGDSGVGAGLGADQHYVVDRRGGDDPGRLPEGRRCL